MIAADYTLEARAIPASEGGGWHVTGPGLPGCMSDGDTIEEAMANVEDAIGCWIDAAGRIGRSVPPLTVVVERRA